MAINRELKHSNDVMIVSDNRKHVTLVILLLIQYCIVDHLFRIIADIKKGKEKLYLKVLKANLPNYSVFFNYYND